MSAAEMSVFARCLGVMIGDFVPEDHKSWNLYLALRKIMDIALARYVTEAFVLEMEEVVEEHNRLYLALFPDTLKFKHHVLVHYPRVRLKSDLCFKRQI